MSGKEKNGAIPLAPEPQANKIFSIDAVRKTLESRKGLVDRELERAKERLAQMHGYAQAVSDIIADFEGLQDSNGHSTN